MLTGQTLWGSSRPRFKLPTVADGALRAVGGRQAERLPGTFDFTQTSANVTASQSMSDLLLPGDQIAQDVTKFYTILTVSGTAIVLTAVFAEATAAASRAYSDRSSIWMPFTSQTMFRFQAERPDGGSTVVRLAGGRLIRRATGWRVDVQFRWDYLDRESFAKIVSLHNYGLSNPIDVTPHDDVAIVWRMIDVSEVGSEWPDGKLVGHAHTASFQSEGLILDIPLAHNALTNAGFRPVVGL